MRRLFIVFMLATVASPAMADDYKVMFQAATVIAATEPCGFTVNENAMVKYFVKNIEADDINLEGTLNTMVYGAVMSFKKMTSLQRRDHCTKALRVAKAYGLVK